MNRIEPEKIAEIRQHIRESTGATEALDRRGFRLLQWPSLVTGRKPIELSLEHEARLKPPGPAQLSSLLTRLALSLEQPAGRVLLPCSVAHTELTVVPVRRRVGPQSVDVYFDLPDGGFVSGGYTFRQRIVGRRFMTWSGEGEGLAALNLELPAVDLNLNGLTARLEFNWLDQPSAALRDTEDPERANKTPIRLVAGLSGLDLRKLIPAFENTTVRQKFMMRSGARPIFALNIDFIRTRDLRRGVEAQFVDIDLSSVNVVDNCEILALGALSGALMSTYALEFNFETKVSRARRILAALS